MPAGETSTNELIPRRWWWALLGAGVGLLLVGVALAVVLSAPFVVDMPGARALPFMDEYPTVTEILQPPFVCFLVGGCLTFTGELLRRGTMLKGTRTNSVVFRPLGLVVHASWLAVAVAIWGLTVPGMLALLGTAAGTPSRSSLDADSDPVFLIGVYGGLAALMAGALLASLVKKVWFRAAVRRRGTPTRTSPFWWTFSFHWRGDVWIAAIGALLLGLAPLPIHLGSPVGIAVTLGAGSVVLVIGLAACTQYWRAGMPLGIGSSLTGGHATLLTQDGVLGHGSAQRG